MNAKKRPRFDIDALRALAGDKVFARAEVYFRAGQVEILSIGPDRVLAQVAGTQDYRTVLTGGLTGGRAEIGGECSCPAFGNWGFCKHMAAAALAANADGDDDGADGGGALARIRDHLETKSVEALAGMIVGLAENDPALFRRLDMAAATLKADGKTLETRLRKAFDSTVRTRGFIDYSQAPGWAAGVEAALDTLADLIPDGHAGLVRKLAEHAIVRIGKAVENIDDSDGHCMFLFNHAQKIHLAACRAAPPDPVALARDLFSSEMEDDYDIFHRAVAHYADVLGEDGLAEYRRLAVAGWEKLPPRTGDGRVHHEYVSDYGRLASILDFFAERGGDVAARIALRAKDLSSPWKYLQLAEFCLSQDRKDQALHYAEEGLWVFEDARQDERLVFLVADLMLGAGREQDAKAHLWRTFEREPSLALYRRLRTLGGKDASEPAVAFLRARISKDTATKWHSPADLLIRILMEEKMFDAAWAAMQDHGASGGLKESLARASEATHPREALAVYAGRVEKLVEAGGNPGYEEARGLVSRMGELRGASAQAAYVADLKTRFRRKRNFMKLLG
jgi:uncharacterized Zn finger protein